MQPHFPFVAIPAISIFKIGGSNPHITNEMNGLGMLSPPMPLLENGAGGGIRSHLPTHPRHEQVGLRHGSWRRHSVLHFAAEQARGLTEGSGKTTRKMELVRKPATARNRLDAEIGARKQGNGELELHQPTCPQRGYAQLPVKKMAKMCG